MSAALRPAADPPPVPVPPAWAGRVRFPESGMPRRGDRGPGPPNRARLERRILLEGGANRRGDAIGVEDAAVGAESIALERHGREIDGEATGADHDAAAAASPAGAWSGSGALRRPPLARASPVRTPAEPATAAAEPACARPARGSCRTEV